MFEKRLLDNHDLSAYQSLKKLITEDGSWKKKYPKLLKKCENRLTPWEYSSILDNEHEIDKLMTLIRIKPRILDVAFARSLYPRYPGEISSLYYHVVVLNKPETNRNGYRRLANKIREYADFGSIDLAKAWINKLIMMYPRRRAMIEELSVVLNEFLR